MNPPAPVPLTVPELIFIGILVFFFAAWGWRHGLDAAIIAGLFVLFGRLSVDTLAKPIASIVNIFAGLLGVLTGGKFSRDAVMAAIFGGQGAPPPLISMNNPNDTYLKWIGTIIFAMIAFIGFRFAKQKAGGKDSLLETIFGFFGAAVVGYMCVTFVLDRHVTFPQFVVIEPSLAPQISVDAPLIVVIVLVLVVFGIQRAKPAKKK